MTILEKCSDLFQGARKNLFSAAALLYKIRDEELWKEKYESLNEYIEEECLMDKGQASRLLTTFEHYVIKGGVELAQLEEVNPEKLYMARQLQGSPSQQAVKATHLSKQELKAQKIFELKGAECEHTHTIQICADCGKRI